jgi:transposase
LIPIINSSINATHIKVHPHAAGASSNQEMSRSKGGSIRNYIWPWMRMVCKSESLLQMVTADCTQACQLIEGLDATYLLADRGYDSDAVVAHAEDKGMIAVIPPRKNRKVQRKYDRDLYKLRHLVENAFLYLKRWRGIASRYAKDAKSFLAVVQIGCIALWVDVL